MKLLLEVYLVSYVKEGFHYVRKELNLVQDQRDPDQIANEYLKYLFNDSRLITDKEKYILHSTSWRYEIPNRVLLTYVVYADSFIFKGMNPRLIRTKDLHIARSSNAKVPRPIRITSDEVVSHGIRHIGYLLRNDARKVFKGIVEKKAKDILLNLSDELAGKI